MSRAFYPLIACLAVAGAIWSAQGKPLRRHFGEPVEFCTITDARITECSGIAADPTREGVFYTHNDSGDKGRFFRFDKNGKITGEFSLHGVEAIDWEDIASANIHGACSIYLGDIGDNKGKRGEVKVYKVAVPSGSSTEVSKFDTYTLTYPDRPYNAECLFVNPANGDIYIVTKHKDTAGVYKCASPARSGRFQMNYLGDLTLPNGSAVDTHLITAGDCSPDGKHVIVRTYLAAYEFEVPTNFDEWFKRSPTKINMPLMFQGEAICYVVDGKSLLTASEGTPCPVFRVPIED